MEAANGAVVRKHQSVPFSEVEPIINKALEVSKDSETYIMESIGYSNSPIAEWRNHNRVPVRAKYALEGFIAEHSTPPKVPQFSFDELTALFAALSGWRVPEEVRKTLVRKIAAEMQSC